MKKTGKRFGKRLAGTCVVIVLVSIILVSCGIKEELQAEKETGLSIDGINVDQEKDSAASTENMSNISVEKDQSSFELRMEKEEINQGNIGNSKEAIREGEELAIIQAQYRQDKEYGGQGSLFQYPEYLVEIEIPELYVKTQMRAYQAFTLSDNPAGSYLLYQQVALAVSDSFEETCIADIDQNGEYELLSLYGWGSGIYRIHLNVYQARNPDFFCSTTKIPMLCYQNCFVPKAGFGQLGFDQVSDTEVHLMEFDLETNEVSKDYGKLVIYPNKKSITLDKLEDFPYDIWDSVFNQENWSTQEYDYESLTAIPELTVSVGDTIIANESVMTDWVGKKEESVAFSELMTGEIAQFSPPAGIYKFDQEIKLDFGEIRPSSIKVTDTLLTKEGQQIYSDREILERAVKKGEDGSYYYGLENHFALLLSSNSASYTNPSYRGYRVICEYGENRSCEYVYVLSLGPIWKESKD